MAAWFSSRLGELVEVPSLQGIGLRLVGGRLLAGDDGPVAQLIYEDPAGYRVTLCLSSAPNDGGSEVEVVTIEGLTAGYWHEGDLTYALVGQTSEQQPVAIATQLGADQPNEWLQSKRALAASHRLRGARASGPTASLLTLSAGLIVTLLPVGHATTCLRDGSSTRADDGRRSGGGGRRPRD